MNPDGKGGIYRKILNSAIEYSKDKAIEMIGEGKA
jgi:hypothetical protein